MAEDEAGHTEIDSSLNPENADLWQDLTDAGTHRVDADEGAHAKGAGEDPRDALPVAGNAGLRPRYASHKQQGY